MADVTVPPDPQTEVTQWHSCQGVMRVGEPRLRGSTGGEEAEESRQGKQYH